MFRLNTCTFAIFAIWIGFAWPMTVNATSSHGRNARLLGVFGDQRYALIVDEDIQDGCFGARCKAYVVDLKKAKFRRLFLTNIPVRKEGVGEEHEIVAALAQNLPKRMKRKLKKRWTPAEELTKLWFENAKEGKPLTAKHGDESWVFKMTRTKTVNAMRTFSTIGNLAKCDPEKVLCSTCRKVRRIVGSRRVATISCTKGTGYVVVKGKKKPCNCYAKGEIRRLDVIRANKSGRTTQRGSSVLLEPYRMVQNQLLNPDEASGSYHSELTGSALEGFMTKPGRAIFLGGVVHAPAAHSTSSAVVVVSQPL